MITGNLELKASNVGPHGDTRRQGKGELLFHGRISQTWTRKLLDWERRRREADGPMVPFSSLGCWHLEQDDNMASTLNMSQESLKIFLGDLDKMVGQTLFRTVLGKALKVPGEEVCG